MDANIADEKIISAQTVFTEIEQTLSISGLLANCIREKQGFWQIKTTSTSNKLDAFNSWNGVTLHERAKIELTTAHYETEVYRRVVKKSLIGIQCGFALELGAGDGRITHMLLENWKGFIVACDCNRPALERLHASLTPQESNRLIILCGDITSILLDKINFSLIFAFETLYYLNHDFKAFLARLALSLTICGKLVHAEPTVVGGLLLCLAIDDWDGATIASQNNLVEGCYNGFTLEEMINIYAECGLKLCDTDTTSLVNLILVNRLVRSNLPHTQRLETVRRIRANLEKFSIPRCIVYTASKV